MTAEECKKCKHHIRYENCAVYCKYDQNLVTRATTFNEKLKDYVVLACPKDKG